MSTTLQPSSDFATPIRPRPARAVARYATPLAVALLVALVALGHVAANAVSPFGVHRDELLYLAMGRHLRLWAMDFPPLIAILANVSRAVAAPFAPDSLPALRLLPALAGAALVAVAAATARRVGAGTGAQLLAGGAVALSPLFLRSGTLFQPVVFDQLWWSIGAYALLRLGGQHDVDRRGRTVTIAPESARWWFVLGIAGGLGLLTKFSIGFFAVGALVAVAATPLRRALATPWPWIAFVVAAAIGAPSVVGQVRLGWPVSGQLADLQQSQLTQVTYAGFVLEQLLFGPLVPLSALGAVWAMADRHARAARPAVIALAVAFLTLLVLRGKPYYVGPIYPVLAGLGAAALDQFRGSSGSVLRVVTAVAVLAYGAAALPLGVPILPPEQTARWAETLGVSQATRTNTGGALRLPQDYADMLGWRAQAEAVARIYRALPPERRDRAVVMAGNYGEAGALDLYGPSLGLPPAVSPAGSYWFFGPGAKPGDTVVMLGQDSTALAPHFVACEPSTRVVHRDMPWVVDEERDVPITVCDGIRRPLQAMWPELAGRN